MRETSYEDTFTVEHEPPGDLWPEILSAPTWTNYSTEVNASVELIGDTAPLAHSSQRALIAEDGEWTYAALLEAVKAAASVLRSSGVRPGNRVLLRGPNNGHLVISWLAVIRIGAVAVTTVPLLRAGELNTICDISQPTLGIVDYRFVDEWEAVGFDGTTIVYGHGGPDSLEAKMQSKIGDCSSHTTLANDTAILAFTSGTTGQPKATMHSHQDLLVIADTYANEVIQPRSNDVFAGTPPLAFTFGLGGLLIFPLRHGATSLLLEQASPSRLLASIETYRVTCLFTAPTGYRGLLRELDHHDITSLRCCISAGEALAVSTQEAWHERTGLDLIDGIGSTEMLHIFISNRIGERHSGTLGRPVTGYEAIVVDDRMNRVPPRTPGRLAVKGPTGCRYLNDPRQSHYVQSGWNVTGDIFTEDEEGFFRYVARADDIIVTSGYNIGAPEVENALLTHESVLEVAVVGLPDEERGQIVTAYVVTSPEVQPDEHLIRVLQEHVKTLIAPYKYPRRIEFVKTLPKSTTGKLQRYRLKHS